MRGDFAPQCLARLRGQRRRSGVLVVGNDCPAGIDPGRVDAGGLKRAGHDAAAEQLARRGDPVAGSRRGFAQDRQRGQHRAQLVDVLLDRRGHRGPARQAAPARRSPRDAGDGFPRRRSQSSPARRATRRPSSAGAGRSPWTWRRRPRPAALPIGRPGPKRLRSADEWHPRSPPTSRRISSPRSSSTRCPSRYGVSGVDGR